MPEAPINLNLARIVHRVLTQPRGWKIDELQQELGIAQRTYRKYREVLTEQFEPFRRPSGGSVLREVKDDGGRWLRLAGSELKLNDRDFLARIAALHFARQMLSFLSSTDVGQALGDIFADFRSRVGDSSFVLDHVMRNVDRLFVFVPHAHKEYGQQGDLLSTIMHALVYQRRIVIDYDPASGQRREYIVNPLTLMSYRGGLYLIAQLHPSLEQRTFAIDRALHVHTLSEGFEYPDEASYHPAQQNTAAFGIYQPSSTADIRVELVFRAEKFVLRDLRERIWHPSQQFLDLPDGRLAMSFRVNSLAEVRPWVLSYGDAVEIVSPPPSSRLWQPT